MNLFTEWRQWADNSSANAVACAHGYFLGAVLSLADDDEPTKEEIARTMRGAILFAEENFPQS